MSANIIRQPEVEVNNARFVSPKSSDELTPAEQYELGRRLYQRGKRISECRTDDMCAGYLDAEYAGRVAYLRAMQREGYVAAVAMEAM